MATTRLGQFGVGVDAYLGFVSKFGRGSQQFTRLTQFGVGGAKYGTFLAKTAAQPVEPEVPVFVGGAVRFLRPRPLFVRNGQADGVVLDVRIQFLPGTAAGTANAQTGEAQVLLGVGLVEGQGSGGAIADGQRLPIFSVSLHPGVAVGERNLSDEELMIFAVAA